MRRKIVAGNWKMNGSLAAIDSYLSALQESASEAECVLAVPSHMLTSMAQGIQQVGKAIALAAQNVSSFEQGAYTGEVSAAMLKEAGCRYCLVGHSERRALFGESNEDALAKVRQLLKQEIIPVLCVGETLAERDAGQAEQVVSDQITAVVSQLDVSECRQLVFAYEPVWAIGTGKTASPEQAQAMHAAIRAVLAEFDAAMADAATLLYGGSVNASNASALFAQQDIDGGLVGGASLKADEFSQICEAIG